MGPAVMLDEYPFRLSGRYAKVRQQQIQAHNQKTVTVTGKRRKPELLIAGLITTRARAILRSAAPTVRGIGCAAVA
jgi:hypothetical protein